MMIVAGRVSQKMGPVLRQIYDQMPDPKWVDSMGACASCGGIFNNYPSSRGWTSRPSRCLHPRLPAPPEGLLDAVIKLQKKMPQPRSAASGVGS